MKMENKQKLWIVSYTTNATLLINETIIHFLLGLSNDKHTNITKHNSIIDIWGTPISNSSLLTKYQW
jgi:hypothetical protein